MARVQHHRVHGLGEILGTVVSRRGLLWLVVAMGLTGCAKSGHSASLASSSSSPMASSSAPSTPSTTGTTVASTIPGLTEASGLRFDGIGPVRIGMTLAEASAALNRPVSAGPRDLNELCTYAKVDGLPAGLAFMLGRDNASDPWTIVRTDVEDNSTIATLSGIRIGATEDQVKHTYSGPGHTGRLEVEPHEYIKGGHYISYDADGPAGNVMLFETDDQKVVAIRSGQQKAVGYVEGCA